MSTARDSLQWRFLAVVVAAALPFCVLAGVLAWQLGASRARADAQLTVQALVATVHKTSAIGAYARDEVLLQEVVDGLQAHALVARAEVVAGDGGLLVSRGPAGPAGPGQPVERRLASPFDPDEELGVLRVTINGEELDRVALSRAATLSALMVAQAALGALVLYIAAARFVSRPIVQLSRGLRAMQPGTAQGMVEGVMYDITDRKRVEHAVRHRAEHDSLTGLKNRAATDTALDQFVANAVRTAVPVTVLCIDLDGFKAVNDSLGHEAGDEVLLQCARHMGRLARRASDLVGRVGGDEFVIALPHLTPDDAAVPQLAAGLVAALCEPMVLKGGQVVRVGASVGIACAPWHGASRQQVLHAADEALYAVKRTGKNTFAMAAPLPRGGGSAAPAQPPRAPSSDSTTACV